MKRGMVVLAIILGSLAIVFGCTDDEQENGPETSLVREEVLRIAEQTAESEGFDISEYDMTGCHYESTGEDGTWTVFYELKPPTPPGGHFMVSVDDQTKQATLTRGE